MLSVLSVQLLPVAHVLQIYANLGTVSTPADEEGERRC